MNNDELTARIVVLETFVVATLSIIFAGAPDPGKRKAIATLDAIKRESLAELATLSPAIVRAGENYLDTLLSEISENIDRLRPNDPK